MSRRVPRLTCRGGRLVQKRERDSRFCEPPGRTAELPCG